MSKSDPNNNGTLFITDEPKVIRKKIMSAVTDSGSEIKVSDDKPGVTNLLNIMSAATGDSVAALEKQFEGHNYAAFKSAVADSVVDLLTPIHEKFNEIASDKTYLNGVFRQGYEVAQKRAYKVLSKVYKKAGLVERPR